MRKFERDLKKCKIIIIKNYFNGFLSKITMSLTEIN